MRRIYPILILFTFFIVFISQKSSIFAAPESCSSIGINLDSSTSNLSGPIYYRQPYNFQVSASGSGITDGKKYYLTVFGASIDNNASGNSVSFNLNATTSHAWVSTIGENQIVLSFLNGAIRQECLLGKYNLLPTALKCDSLYVYQQRGGQQCYAGPGGCLSNEGDPTLNVEAKVLDGTNPYNGSIKIKLDGNDEDKAGQASGIYSHAFGGQHSVGQHRVEIRDNRPGSTNPIICTANIVVSGSCGTECLPRTNIAVNTASMTGSTEPYKICEQIDRAQPHLVAAFDSCIECLGGSETGTNGIWTAIGCIKRDPTEIVQNLLRVGLGMGGGVALLMILAAGFLFSISQGDPKRTGEAKELITAAITGLLFIIFSVVILQFIGYTVLQIPGFGG